MLGTETGKFSPDRALDRAMFVTILYRLAGSPEVTGIPPFYDTYTIYCSDAVTWAYKNGITKGFGDGTFRPWQQINREQMACMLERFVKAMDYDFLNDPIAEKSFTDINSVSDYAKDSVCFCANYELMSGYADGSFGARDTVTRAQTAMVISRLAQK